MNNLLAQNPFGKVNPPPGVAKFSGGAVGGIGTFVNVIIQTLIIGIGLYALINIILGGYGFLAAGGDPKKIESAWARIWQSILGVAVAAGSFVIVAIIGILFFGDPFALLALRIITP